MSNGEDDSGFDKLMSTLGVRRMDSDAKSQPPGRAKRSPGRGQIGALRGARVPSRPVTARSAPSPAADPPSRPPPAATPPPGRPSSADTDAAVQESVEPAPPPILSPESPESTSSGGAAGEADAAAIETAIQTATLELRDALAALQTERDQLVDEVAGARQEIARLAPLAGEAAGGLAVPTAATPLRTLLAARGLLGDHEAGQALGALVQARLVAPLLDGLVAMEPERTARLLSERLVLASAETVERVPAGRAVVEIPAERCEVTGGLDLVASGRRFTDACMLNGWTRVAIVGGNAWQHRVLGEDLVDARIRLRLLPAGAGLAGAVDSSGPAGPQVVVRWLRPGQSASDRSFEPPPIVVDVYADTVAGLLVGAARELKTAAGR